MGTSTAVSAAEVVAGLPAPLVALWVGFLGAVVGSFLNVVITRVPAGQSIVRPRSRCPACGATIGWYDNVPILSWLALRARCRACKARISARYPLVEMAGGLVALLAWWRHDLSFSALAEFALVAVLLALAFIDLDTWLLPNVLTRPLLALGLLASAAGLSAAPSLRWSAYGAGVGFAVFGLVLVVGRWVFRREALGMGDVWLLAALGAWLGLSALLPVVLFASIQGSIVGLALIALGKGQPGPPAVPPPAAGSPAADDDWVPPRNAVPFGPFLVAGALEWLYLAPTMEQLSPLFGVFR